jgi:NADPH:quinone reductase-like Zn-dependent oxidoreductase
MHAWRLNDSGLSAGDVPEPKPASGEVLIRVQAAGVTPTELLWYPTTHTKTGERREHAIRE